MMKRMIVPLIVLIVALACVQPPVGRNVDVVATAEAQQNQRTPTIPAGFVSFTNELNRFIISYPSNWELEEQMPVGTVFSAGMPPQNNPNVSIGVETVPERLNVAEYYADIEILVREIRTGFKPHSRASVLLGKNEAIMTDSEFDRSSLVPGAIGKIRVVQAVTVDGEVGWTISCGIGLPASAQDRRTCDSVVRSFRIPQ